MARDLPDRTESTGDLIARTCLGSLGLVALWLSGVETGIDHASAWVPVGALLLLAAITVKPGSGRGRGHDGVLILGKSDLAGKLYTQLANGSAGAAFPGAGDARPGVLGAEVDPDDLKEMILREGISSVVIAEPDVETHEALAAMLIECKFRGIQIHQAPDFYESLNQKVWLEALWPGWFIFSDGFQLSRRDQFFKRVMDVVCALVLLVFLAPLMLVIAVAIKLDSPGPVLFMQERLGQFGKPFPIFKFRSMRQDAERDTGPVWARKDDDRVTRVGAYLRRTHLDELPQLLNVLRNELSFVGPRPERPAFVESLSQQIPFYQVRHYLKPGITGWAQVSFPYGDSVKAAYEKLQYDLYYAKHASFLFDLKVILRTVKQVLLGKGDRRPS